MTAIITCGETRQSLASVRALGRAQIPVAVGATKRPSLAMWSRFATSTFLTEDPLANAKVFASQIAEELEARYAHCVLVSSDEAYWALSCFRDLLPLAARRIFPPHISVVRSLDHEALHYFAESLGISCAPLVRVPDQASATLALSLMKGLPYPLLLRPIITCHEREGGMRPALKRIVVKTKDDFLDLHAMPGALGTNGFLVSQSFADRAVSYFGVADRGHVLVEGFSERLSDIDPVNETGTLSATINPVVSIRRSSQLLLDALQWQGPFKLEYLRDHRGHYRLNALIGRLWASLPLAIRAQVNIPLICYGMAEGTLTKAILHNAKPHVRLRWLVGDVLAKIRHPWQTMFNARHLVSIMRPKNLWHSLKRHDKTKTYYDVIDKDDPMPFLFELQNQAWKKAFIERFGLSD